MRWRSCLRSPSRPGRWIRSGAVSIGLTSPARPPLRLLAVAAILVLLAAAAFTVGAEVLRRDRDRDLSVVPPTAPIESPLSSPGPAGLAAGSVVDVVVERPPRADPADGRQLEVSEARSAAHASGRNCRSSKARSRPTITTGTSCRRSACRTVAGWPRPTTMASPGSRTARSLRHPPSPYTAVEADLIAGLRSDAVVQLRPQAEGPACSSHGRRRMPPQQRPRRAVRRVPFSRCTRRRPDVSRAAGRERRRRRRAAIAPPERAVTRRGCPATGRPAARRIESPSAASDRWVVGRSGCFLDDDGTANVRLTCGPTYIGIVGRSGDLAALDEWAWRSEAGQVPSGDPPGICASGV